MFKLFIMVQKRRNHKIKQISPLKPILGLKLSVTSERHDGQISIEGRCLLIQKYFCVVYDYAENWG